MNNSDTRLFTKTLIATLSILMITGFSAAAIYDVGGGNDDYSDLQTALDDSTVSNEDTLKVYENGGYGQINIDKEVTIAAADGENPVISYSGSGGEPAVAINANNVEFNGFDIDRTGADTSTPAQAIYVGSKSAVKTVDILNNDVAGDNKAESDQNFGIYVDDENGHAKSVTIKDNEVRKFSGGILVTTGYGNDLSNINVESNIVSNNAIGVGVSDFGDTSTNPDVQITGNEIKNNNVYGIKVPGSGDTMFTYDKSDLDLSNLAVNNNEIQSNADGLYASGTNTLDSTSNYWGVRLGPSNGDNPRDTSGNSVSGDLKFKPWYIDSELTTLTSDVLYSYSAYPGSGYSDIVTSGDNLELSFTDATDLAGETFTKSGEEITVKTSDLAGYDSDTSVDVDFSSSADSEGVENNVEILNSDEAKNLNNQDSTGAVGTDGTETSANNSAQADSYVLVDQDGPLLTASQEPLGDTEDNRAQISFSVSDSQPSNVGSIDSVTLKDSENSPVGGVDSVTDSDEHVSFSGIGSETANVEIDPAFDGATDNFTMPDGQMTVEVQATDEYGNQETDSFTFLVDTEAPKLDSVSKAIVKEVKVTFKDSNSGIDPNSIQNSDFSVSGTDVSYTVDARGASNGDNSVPVYLEFDSNIDQDELTVSLQEDGIKDMAGNALTSGSGTAQGMDNVNPEITETNLADQTNDDSTVKDGDSVRVYATVTDGTGISSVEADLSDFGAGNSVTLHAEDSDSGENWNGNQDSSESNVYGAEVTVDSGSATEGTGKSASIRATDSSDGSNSVTTKEFGSIKTDFSSPSISSANTNDLNKDGRIDQINVTLTEAIDNSESTLNSSAFSLETGKVNSVETEATDDDKLELGVSGISDTSITPDVTLATGLSQVDLKDGLGNTKTSNQTFEGTADEANPVLLHAVIDHRQSDSSGTHVNLEFSETVDGDGQDSDAVSIDGKSFGISESESSTVDYGEVLQTGDSPLVDVKSEVVDAVGNSAVNLSGGNVDVDTFRKDVSSGWNFVSFPIAGTTNPSIDSVIGDTSSVDSVWKYEDGEWESWTPESDNENDFSKINGGEGYLVKASSGYTLAPNVNNLQDTKSEAQVQLGEGFNLVGHFEEFNQDADATDDSGAFASLDGSFLQVKKQKSGLVTKETKATDGIKTGSAYWVQTQGDLSDGSVAFTAN